MQCRDKFQNDIKSYVPEEFKKMQEYSKNYIVSLRQNNIIFDTDVYGALIEICHRTA